jgi:hypothetical protein
MTQKYSVARAAVTALVFGWASAHAHADTIDMSTVTCADMATMSTEEASTTLIWLDGWLAGQADETTVDADQIGEQIDGIATICGEKPQLSVMNAAKEYLNN